MEASDNYLLVINGKPEGPYTIEQLRSLKINPTDFVRSQVMDDYKEAHEIPELRQLFGFVKPPHIPQYFAGFDQRLLASALDWFMVAGILVILAVLPLIFINDKQAQYILVFSLFIIIPLVNLVYHIVMESSGRQATIGKQILKIKVCDMFGEPLTPAQAIGRNLAKILSVITLFIGYLFSFFNRKQQCLHDMVAGTLVIKDRLI